jgi:CRP-like cAMP-binding protein
VFGEMALLDGEPRSASVTTMEKCALPGDVAAGFPALPGAQPPDWRSSLLAALSKRLRATNDMVGGT